MSTSKRVLLALGTVFVVFASYARFLGVQTYYVLEARKLARQSPLVSVVPTELADLSISEARGRKLSYFGYEFEVPWDDLDQDKTKVVADNSAAIIVFHSGKALELLNSPWLGTISALTKSVGKIGKVDIKPVQGLLGQAYGDEAVHSDYAFERALLEVTPSKFSLLMPAQQALKQGKLMELKGAYLFKGRGDSGIYFITTSAFRGFQYGYFQSQTKSVNIELFSDNGNLQLIFGQTPGGSTIISQADINRVVGSIHATAIPRNALNFK